MMIDWAKRIFSTVLVGRAITLCFGEWVLNVERDFHVRCVWRSPKSCRSKQSKQSHSQMETTDVLREYAKKFGFLFRYAFFCCCCFVFISLEFSFSRSVRGFATFTCFCWLMAAFFAAAASFRFFFFFVVVFAAATASAAGVPIARLCVLVDLACTQRKVFLENA